MGEDCPVFDGLFEFCQLSTGGSVGKCVWVCVVHAYQPCKIFHMSDTGTKNVIKEKTLSLRV